VFFSEHSVYWVLLNRWIRTSTLLFK